MELFTDIDWALMLTPETALTEIFIRGTVMYLALFGLLRFALRRSAGVIALPDVLLVVLLADAAQNGMADDYRSITDGLFLVGTIVFWSYMLDWMSFRFAVFRRLTHSQPSPLIQDGKISWAAMRHHLISRAELMTQIREQGLEDVSQVKAAYLEGDGRISIIAKDGRAQGTRREGTGSL